jgi:hypothetical protein
MKRSILAALVGLAVWVLVASLLNRGLRFGLAGYALAEPTMTFTLGMKIARLILGALASLAAGAATAAIAHSSPRLPWVVGAILLVAFIPEHILIWVKFPVWYHLVFLVTLAPLVALGAALCRRRAPSERSA